MKNYIGILGSCATGKSTRLNLFVDYLDTVAQVPSHLDLQGSVKRNSGFEEREDRKASFPAANLLEVRPVVEIELERAIVSSTAGCVRKLNPSLLPLASHLEEPW